jgi:hypothetical protein
MDKKSAPLPPADTSIGNAKIASRLLNKYNKYHLLPGFKP